LKSKAKIMLKKFQNLYYFMFWRFGLEMLSL
jgi:hypothetical protein